MRSELRRALENQGVDPEDLGSAAFVDLIDAAFEFALDVLFPGDEGRAEEWAEKWATKHG